MLYAPSQGRVARAPGRGEADPKPTRHGRALTNLVRVALSPPVMPPCLRRTPVRPSRRVYGVSLFTTTVLVSVLWGSIVRDRRLLKPEVSEEEITAVTVAATPNTALGAVVLAIIVPKAAAFVYLAAAIAGVLRARGDPVQDRS